MQLHDRLIAKQSDAELRRKMVKAKRRSIWTQEEIDVAFRNADKMIEWINRAEG